MRYTLILLFPFFLAACQSDNRRLPQPEIEKPRVGVGCTEDPIGYQDAWQEQKELDEEKRKRAEIEALIEECTNE